MTDVARAAGVSHQTVSRVLNQHPHVSPRTRALVLATMRELDYRPNGAARTLASGHSRTLGVLTLGGTYYGPASTSAGVEEAAVSAGYSVMLVNLPSTDPAAMEQAAERLRQSGVDGVVAIAPFNASAEGLQRIARDLPLVAVEGSPRGELAVVRVDQEAGARLATQHLLDLGHETVWHVSGPDARDWFETAARIQGWERALQDSSVEIPPPLLGDWSAASGYQAGLVLGGTDLTAVFVANDQMALGLLRALRERGRRVPEDVSVVGFDDIPEAGYFLPPLTTIRQDFAEVGRQALRTLLAQIESQTTSAELAVIPPELVVRQSTRDVGKDVVSEQEIVPPQSEGT